MGSLQQVLHSLQSTLFNIWQLALQLSHEILKTALPLYIKNSPKWNSLVGKIGTSHDYFHSYYFPVEKCTWLCLLAANVVCVWVIAMPKYHVMYGLDGDQSGIIWLELLLFGTNYC